MISSGERANKTNNQQPPLRAGDGSRTHDLLLGKETFYQLNYARRADLYQVRSAESQDRTDDTAIFSRVLYQLSYLGRFTRFSRMRANFTRCMLIVKHRPKLKILSPAVNLPFHWNYVIINLRTSGCPPHPGVRNLFYMTIITSICDIPSLWQNSLDIRLTNSSNPL